MLKVNSQPNSEGTRTTQVKTRLWKFGETYNLMVNNPMAQSLWHNLKLQPITLFQWFNSVLNLE
jgi:hypothetical protein